MALESEWIICAHEKSNNEETPENKHAHVSNCTRTCTSLCLHKSGSIGLFHTSSCRKHFDFLKVNVQVTVALDQGISRLCDLFHNLWTGNIIRRITASRFIRRTPAFRLIRQLTHWLCIPLFSNSANRCQHRPADTTHQTCELYTQVRQSHGFSLR